MRILKLGTKRYQPSYIYTCELCGCKFQFFDWEIEYTNPNFKSMSYVQCNCPQCNSLIIIKNLEDYEE